MRARHALSTLAVLLAAGLAPAQQPLPQLLSVFPPGAKGGETVEVTCSGHNLDGSEKLLFSGKDVGFKAEPVGAATAAKAQQNQPTSRVKFKVTVPSPNFGGTYDVRVVTKNGLSNPRPFVVSGMTDVSEAEPNNDVGQAQKVELETTVNGVIGAPTDVDYVTFRAKAGQSVVVYCLTTSIDSKMQADLMVAGPDGKPLASNHNYRGGDAVLDFKAPADGDYFVRLSQFAYTSGGYDHFYRLTVTTRMWVDAVFPPILSEGNKKPRGYGRSFPKEFFPERSRFARPDGRPFDEMEMWVSPEHVLFADKEGFRSRVIPPHAAGSDIIGGLLVGSPAIVLDNEKNDTPADAQAVKVPCDIAGRVAKKGDRHWYKFDAKKGDVWTLEVFAERIGSPVDAYFILTDGKGKVLTEQDDGPDTLSPNQFYTKSDDPGRYKFTAPADGTYRVMVSTREAGTQFGVRDQYVLRIAKEHPDFRVAVMPMSTHVPEGGTLPKGGAVAFAVFAFRFDGFNDAIELTASGLPDGVTCPPQVIGPGQTRGTLVLVAEKDAKDWAGFVKVTAKGGEREYAARPFTVTWPAAGVQQNQVPNFPMITRMDRGDGMALAVRGEAAFTLTPTKTELTAKAGGKLEVTLKVARDAKFKDGIQVFNATPDFGVRQRGNQPAQPLATAAGTAAEVKVSIDLPNSLPPGTHTLVLRGQSAAPVPKRGNNAPLTVQPTLVALPIALTVEGGGKRK